MKEQKWGRIINISGPTPATRNLSGGRRNTSLVHLTKTLAVQVGRFGITVNCIHPASRAPSGLHDWWRPRGGAGRGSRGSRDRDFAPDSPAATHLPHGGRRRDRLRHRVPASDKAWAVTGELIVATGGAGRSVYY